MDRRFFRAAEESGLRLSSSIAVPVCCPPCDSLVLFGGKHRVGGMLELPIFCYNYRIGGADRRRALCITACSTAEIISVLRQAHARRLSPIVILTHPQEFLKKTDFRYTNIRRNRVNQARLRAVLAFLKQHKDQFVTTPISAISDDLGDSKGIDHPLASVSRPKALARIFENGINDRLWWY